MSGSDVFETKGLCGVRESNPWTPVWTPIQLLWTSVLNFSDLTRTGVTTLHPTTQNKCTYGWYMYSRQIYSCTLCFFLKSVVAPVKRGGVDGAQGAISNVVLGSLCLVVFHILRLLSQEYTLYSKFFLWFHPRNSWDWLGMGNHFLIIIWSFRNFASNHILLVKLKYSFLPTRIFFSGFRG